MSRQECAVIIMGVSGAGKTTVGKALACAWDAHFLDADDYHPQSNVEKMRRGEPLDEQDRAPWLARLAQLLRESELPAVLACSALREAYRRALGVDNQRVRLVYLQLPTDTLEVRLDSRLGHFAGPALLASQLLALEEPREGLRLDGTLDVPTLVASIERWLDEELS